MNSFERTLANLLLEIEDCDDKDSITAESCRKDIEGYSEDFSWTDESDMGDTLVTQSKFPLI